MTLRRQIKELLELDTITVADQRRLFELQTKEREAGTREEEGLSFGDAQYIHTLWTRHKQTPVLRPF